MEQAKCYAIVGKQAIFVSSSLHIRAPKTWLDSVMKNRMYSKKTK
jgi:hypothetical protein